MGKRDVEQPRADVGGAPRPRGNRPRAPLLRLITFGLLLAGVFAVALVIAPHSARGLRDSLHGIGTWGPLVVVTVYALLTCAMVPGPVLAGASGLLFGTALGAAVAVTGATLGATLAFLIARRVAYRPFAAVASPRVSYRTERIQAHGFVAVLYARIAPGAPFALISYGAGMTGVRLRDFVLATLIGASPRAFAYAALGGSLGNYSSPEALVALGVLGVMAIGGTAMLWRTRHLGRRNALNRPAPARPDEDPAGCSRQFPGRGSDPRESF
jgi:uncharacterized membrane protein YdjX (TVP38/TMEM64 family)